MDKDDRAACEPARILKRTSWTFIDNSHHIHLQLGLLELRCRCCCCICSTLLGRKAPSYVAGTNTLKRRHAEGSAVIGVNVKNTANTENTAKQRARDCICVPCSRGTPKDTQGSGAEQVWEASSLGSCSKLGTAGGGHNARNAAAVIYMSAPSGGHSTRSTAAVKYVSTAGYGHDARIAAAVKYASMAGCGHSARSVVK